MIIDYNKVNESLKGLQVNGKGFEEIRNELAAGNMTEAAASKEAVIQVLKAQLDFGKYAGDNKIEADSMDMLADIWLGCDSITTVQDAQDYLNNWIDGYEILNG